MLLKKNRALPEGGTISAKEMKMFKSLFSKPKKSQKAKKPKGK